jgi:hypothetical protein
MTETEVSYHSDYGAGGRPAINVKLHVPGIDYWPDEIDVLGHDVAADLVERAFNEIAEGFWRDAEQQAETLGLGPIEQQGRSGGWLVFTDGRDPREMETDREFTLEEFRDDPSAGYYSRERGDWLTAYGVMREWCEAQLREAPERVRERARSLAIDEIAAPAGARMFAFSREG